MAVGLYDKRRKIAIQGENLGTGRGELFKKGDLVLWKKAGTCSGEKGVNRKMINKYDGPYKVIKVLPHDRYVITSVKRVRGYKAFKAVVAIDSLRRYHSTAGGKEHSGESDSDGEITDRQDLIDLFES